MSDKNDPMTMNITIHPELQTELDQQISHSDGQLTLKTAIARNLAIGLDGQQPHPERKAADHDDGRIRQAYSWCLRSHFSITHLHNHFFLAKCYSPGHRLRPTPIALCDFKSSIHKPERISPSDEIQTQSRFESLYPTGKSLEFNCFSQFVITRTRIKQETIGFG